MTLARMLLFIAAAAFSTLGAAADLETKSTSAGGVVVKVTPKALTPDAAVWDFAVVLDTHTQSLDDDLAKSAVLVDPRGERHSVISWEGAAPGGHHREGVLRFKALPQDTDAFELLIARPGEPAARSFLWNLK